MILCEYLQYLLRALPNFHRVTIVMNFIEDVHYFVRRLESRLPVGSSARIIAGSFTNARAIATLALSPLISIGLVVRSVGRVYHLQNLQQSGSFRFAPPAYISGNATFSSADGLGSGWTAEIQNLFLYYEFRLTNHHPSAHIMSY